MRKVLIMVIIIILLVLGYFMIFKGLNLFGGQLLSVFQIKDKSQQLDADLQKISTLTSVNQPKAMSDLNDSAKQLIIAKEEYNDKVLYSSSEDVKQAAQGIQYEMEHLWVKIGNHATKNGINLKFEAKQSESKGTNQYDLYFTTTGKYVSTSEFIASLENDSSLNFKIENFKLNPYEQNAENLQAHFVVKDIGIKIDKATGLSANSSMNSDNTNSTNTINDNV